MTDRLDDKCFVFFYSGVSDESSVVPGFARFWGGVRQLEFVDRKINPRLLVESQCEWRRVITGKKKNVELTDDSECYRADFSLRVRLATLLIKGNETDMTDQPFDQLGALSRYQRHLSFDPFSNLALPSRLILVGSAASNPAMVSLLSTMFNTPAYFLDETTEMGPDRRLGDHPEPDLQPDGTGSISSDQSQMADGLGHPTELIHSRKTTSSAFGAAKYAAWISHNSSRQETQADSKPPSYREYVSQVKLERSAKDPEAELGRSLSRSETGLTLVAEPDRIEHLFYNSSESVLSRSRESDCSKGICRGIVLSEYARLEGNARRGFI